MTSTINIYLPFNFVKSTITIASGIVDITEKIIPFFFNIIHMCAKFIFFISCINNKCESNLSQISHFIYIYRYFFCERKGRIKILKFSSSSSNYDPLFGSIMFMQTSMNLISFFFPFTQPLEFNFFILCEW